MDLVRVSSLVPFAGVSLIRFNGSRINGLSLMALRQVKSIIGKPLVETKQICSFFGKQKCNSANFSLAAETRPMLL